MRRELAFQPFYFDNNERSSTDLFFFDCPAKTEDTRRRAASVTIALPFFATVSRLRRVPRKKFCLPFLEAPAQYP
jgi:hypothetical protein